MFDAATLVNEAWNAGLTPPPSLSVWEWADQKRWLSSAVTSEAGWWRTDRVPFTRGIMDCLSPMSPAREIWLQKGSQIAGTESGLNWIGFTVDQLPVSTMIVLPDQGTAKEWSQQRLAQLTEDTPCLNGKIKDTRIRDGGNSVFSKKFDGGHLKITWSSSAKKLRSTPAANVLADEVDGFDGDVKGEGDPIALLKRRFTNYPRGKMYGVSTPTLRKISRIEREFGNGDQRYYFLPCPHCGHFQRLVFNRLKWDKGLPETVVLQCIACEKSVEERFKTQMLRDGVWVATATRPQLAAAGFSADALPGLQSAFTEMAAATVVSFHLSALYSPLGWYSWPQIAKDWEAAQGNDSLLKVFVNTVLGETWADRGEAPPFEALLDRREDYLGRVPTGVLLVTSGADIHPDRIEVEVVGWGRNRESWSIDYQILDGRTSEPEVWQKLELLLGEVYVSDDRIEMPISRMFVDSGHATNDVYTWVRQQNTARVVAVKGEHRGLLPVGPPSPVDVTIGGRKIKSGLKIRTVLVSYFKSELYSDLLKRLPSSDELQAGIARPVGLCHFPKDGNYGDEHFKQICSEQLVTSRDRQGRERTEWQQLRPRNEALDCRIYARAAAWSLGMDRFQERHWLELESGRMEEAAASEPEIIADAPLPELRQAPLFGNQKTPAAPARPPQFARVAEFQQPRSRVQIRLGGF